MIDFWGRLQIDLVPEVRGCLQPEVIGLFDLVSSALDVRLRPNQSVLMVCESQRSREVGDDYLYWLWTAENATLTCWEFRVGASLDAVAARRH